MRKRTNIYQHGVDKNNTTNSRAKNDYYSTPSEAVEYLLQYEDFSCDVLEPCIGGGAIAKVLTPKGYNVTGFDIENRGYPNTTIQDFLKYKEEFDGDIITNPPYSIQKEFVLQCIRVAKGKIALLLKLSFLETIGRYDSIFSKFPPHRVYIFVKRISCLKDGVNSTKASSVCYCWYIWDNNKEYENTVLYWIPNHKR